MALQEHGAYIYSMIRTACQPDQIASIYVLDFTCDVLLYATGIQERAVYTIPIRRSHKLRQPYSNHITALFWHMHL